LLALLGAAKAKRNKRKEKTWYPGLTRDNFHGDRINVQRLKGSRFTSQPLIEHADPLLNERQGLFAFLQNVHGKQRLFHITRQRFWQIVQEHAEAAGIAPHLRHPHVLKHTIAMQLIGRAGIEHTRQYLGHESIASTGEYLEVTDDEAAAAAKQALDV
jgi:site-specific recombinase XerD